jgi:uncharacterized membrane protein
MKNRWFQASLVLTGLMLVLSAYFQFVNLEIFPEKVPIHWNANFDADGFISRDRIWLLLWATPVVMLLFCGLTLLLPSISPRKFSIESFEQTWFYVMGLVVGLMAYIHLAIIFGALYSEGHKAIFMKALLGGISLFFALLGNEMGKVRRNFWMGVRTPWTIASETVWNRTHRLAAKLFVGAGLVSFALVMALPTSMAPVAVIGLLAMILPAAIVPIIYSATLYKKLERAGQLDLSDPI